jgi:hypothetical protein
MSTLAMAICWPLKMPPPQKAVLISLADQANDQGFCWPKVETIAIRTCLCERTVRNAIRWLEEAGLLRVGMGEMRSNVYTLTLDGVRPGAPTGTATTPITRGASSLNAPRNKAAPHAPFAGAQTASSDPSTQVRPAPHAAQPAAHAGQTASRAGQGPCEDLFDQASAAGQPAPHAPQPAPHAGQTGTTCPLTVIEPIQELYPQPPEGAEDPRQDDGEDTKASRHKPLVSLATFLAVCKAAGQKPIPEDHPVFGYCDLVGIDRDILLLHWREFKARRTAQGKRQRDWRQTFFNSVRDNWYRLWYLKAGEAAQLTTQGLQAQAMLQHDQGAAE